MGPTACQIGPESFLNPVRDTTLTMFKPGLWISHSAKKMANTAPPAYAATAGLFCAFSYCTAQELV